LPLCSATNASCRGHDVHASRCCLVPHRAPATVCTLPHRHELCSTLGHHANIRSTHARCCPPCITPSRPAGAPPVISTSTGLSRRVPLAPCPSARPLPHLGRRPLARNRMPPGTPRAPLPCRLAPCCAPLLKHNRSCAPPVVLQKRHRPRARHVAGARPEALHRDLPDLEALLCTEHTSSGAPL